MGREPKRTPLSPGDLLAAANLRRIWNERREALGLTQEKVALELGWTQGAFSHYLNDRVALNAVAVLRLARVLRVQPYEIDPRVRPLVSGIDMKLFEEARRIVVAASMRLGKKLSKEDFSWYCAYAYDELLSAKEDHAVAAEAAILRRLRDVFR